LPGPRPLRPRPPGGGRHPQLPERPLPELVLAPPVVPGQAGRRGHPRPGHHRRPPPPPGLPRRPVLCRGPRWDDPVDGPVAGKAMRWRWPLTVLVVVVVAFV